MTSPYVPPDLAALTELERALGHLTAELSTWRRRCQKAEAELQGLKSPGGMVPGDDLSRVRGRLLDLERENLDLRRRVERAKALIARLQQRLVFLEDEHPSEAAR